MALPGCPQSRRPRHSTPYIQPIGLPKEGQRVRMKRLRDLDNRAGNRWLRGEGPGELRSRRRKRPPRNEESREPTVQFAPLMAPGRTASVLTVPGRGSRGLVEEEEENEEGRWSSNPAVSARVGGQTGVFCLSSRSGFRRPAPVFRSGRELRPPQRCRPCLAQPGCSEHLRL